ncbi:hypothetical protein IWX75_000653 [Arthrobacter sp. CAN_A6]|uniref:mycothiol transferase n=1 Tax=Arthrobacter sp. CAN_A6 TaxID=2787721 RepID=UPI0018C9D504
MQASDILLEGYGRLPALVGAAVEGLDGGALVERPGGTGNSIAWLVWHLTRVQDNHFAEAFGEDELWLRDGWAERWGLSLDTLDTGYGHSSGQVDAVGVESSLQLIEYFNAVHSRSLTLIRRVKDEDLERVVDDNWDPPVTLLVRLVSVLDDCLQHAGQAAYARGLISSTRSTG